MSKSRIRIQAAVVAFILLPAAAGVLAVHASATCQRFVRTYVTKPVRNRVSKQTAEAWAAWRLAHPNWKPNPNLHRPKYVMNREEAVKKVDFACTIEVIPTLIDGLLVPAEVPPIVDMPPMEATELMFPNEIPPEVAEITPDSEWPALGPLVPPILGGPPPPIVLPIVPPVVNPVGGGTVAEPASLALAGTGFGFVCLLLAAKTRRLDKQPGLSRGTHQPTFFQTYR